MTDWSASGGVKIERAKEHISDLKAACDTFVNGGTYEVFTDKDGKPWMRVFADPPLRLGAIAGDAIHNLRSALDILWRQVMYPGGGSASNRKISFPIFDTAEEFKAARSRPVRGARKTAHDLLAAIQPYKEGNDALWRLHRLDIADKHHVLLTVATAFTQVWKGNLREITFRARFYSHEPPWECELFQLPERLHHGYINAAGPPADALIQSDDRPQVGLVVTLRERGIVSGEPIIPTVVQLADTVGGVVEAFASAGLLSRRAFGTSDVDFSCSLEGRLT